MESSDRRDDFAMRVLRHPGFAIPWSFFLFFLVIRLWWIRDAALVCWVHGSDAYFVNGVRVLPGKPIRFTTGELAPLIPDMITGFVFFLVTAGGLTALLVLVLRIWDRRRRRERAL